MDIKESRELIQAALGIVNDLANKRSDDGRIDMIEAASVAMSNTPALIRAVQGIDKISGEVKDLTPAEAEELARLGLDLAKGVWALVMGVAPQDEAA